MIFAFLRWIFRNRASIFPTLQFVKLTLLFLVFFRENGADSILDLGLLEAPEKAQVGSKSVFSLL